MIFTCDLDLDYTSGPCLSRISFFCLPPHGFTLLKLIRFPTDFCTPVLLEKPPSSSSESPFPFPSSLRHVPRDRVPRPSSSSARACMGLPTSLPSHRQRSCFLSKACVVSYLMDFHYYHCPSQLDGCIWIGSMASPILRRHIAYRRKSLESRGSTNYDC